MKKRIFVWAVMIVGCSMLATGCGVGNVDMNSSSSSHHETASESSERKASASQYAKKAAAQAKSASIQQRGQQYRYGLPQGPSWLQVYENHHATGAFLSPTKQNVVKLYEGNEFCLAGTLPWVGKLSTESTGVAGASTKATIDQSDSFQYDLDADFFMTDQAFSDLSGGDAKALSSHAFGDLKQYYKAVDDRNAAELPSSSSELKALWGSTGTVADSGALKTRYDVEAQYFDQDSMKVDPSSNGADEATRVEVNIAHNDDNQRLYPTKLYVQTFVKMKETQVAKTTEGGMTNHDYGKSTTAIIQFQVIYQLTDQNTWALSEVEEGNQSQYALDTTKGNWIIEK